MTETTATVGAYFHRRERDDGSTYVTLADGRPEWLYEAVRDAHDDELPNDWRYETCAAIVAAIEEHRAYGGDLDDYDRWGIADALAEMGTSALLSWYAERPARLEYVGRWGDDCGESSVSVDDLTTTLSAGQHYAIMEMVDVIAAAIERQAVTT